MQRMRLPVAFWSEKAPPRRVSGAGALLVVVQNEDQAAARVPASAAIFSSTAARSGAPGTRAR